MSVATLRQKPPPMAGPLTAPMTGWCILRMARMTSSSSSIERWAMVVRVRPAMLGMMPASSRSAPEQNAVAGTGEDHDPGVVVGAGRLQRLSERDHDVERHGVHALGPVERDQRHVRTRLVDEDEAHDGSVAGRGRGGRRRRASAPRRRKVLQ